MPAQKKKSNKTDKSALPVVYKYGKDLYNPEQGVPDLAETAGKHIASWVAGNGLQATDVKVTDKQQDVYSFEVGVDLEFIPIVVEKREHGKSSSGLVCESKMDMQKNIEEIKTQDLETQEVMGLVGAKIKQSPLQGWGLKQKLPLKEIGAEFIYHETCPQCKGKKKESCSKCTGKGKIACFNCKGFGLMECFSCNGAGTITGPDGTQKECSKCHGKRKSKCIECQGKKFMICDMCRGSKYQNCKSCSQTGYHTVRNHVSFETRVSTTVQTENFPPAVFALWEATGEKTFVADKHAQAMLLAPDEVVVSPTEAPHPAPQEEHAAMPGQVLPEQEQAPPSAPVQGDVDLRLRYHVEVPYGHAEFAIGEKRYESDLAGYQSWLVKIEDFIDPLVKQGIGALQKIVKGPMAQSSLIDKALKYRLVKDVFSQTGKTSKGGLLKYLKVTYPRGLSDKYAKACIHYADLAIKALTEKPRMIGMGIGIAVSCAVFAVWFFAGLRTKALASLAEPDHMIADLGLAVVFSVAAYFTVRIFAKSALKKLLAFQAAGRDVKQSLPPAGNQGLYAIAASLLAFAVMAFLTPEQPAWFAEIGL